MNPLADLLITVFLGPFGIHKFLKGKTGMGILYLCTAGLFGIGWLFDCIQAARRFAGSKNPSHAQPAHTFSETGSRREVFLAVGVEHYLSAIARLGHENPNWGKSHASLLEEGLCGKKIFRWNYTNRPVHLIPEPSNPNDPNAVFVQIAGEKVGYISREENRRVLDILNNCSVEEISAFIGGGPYMVVSTNGDVQTLEYRYSVKVTIQYR